MSAPAMKDQASGAGLGAGPLWSPQLAQCPQRLQASLEMGLQGAGGQRGDLVSRRSGRFAQDPTQITAEDPSEQGQRFRADRRAPAAVAAQRSPLLQVKSDQLAFLGWCSAAGALVEQRPVPLQAEQLPEEG